MCTTPSGSDINGYRFTSSLFQIEPGEDQETNPGCYGRQLAIWLKQQLELRGYSVEPVFNEDWGRCLMCSRDPFLLWVGCGSVGEPGLIGQASHEGLVVWHCFVGAEVPFWKGILRRPDMVAAVATLYRDLGAILAETSGIQMVEEP